MASQKFMRLFIYLWGTKGTKVFGVIWFLSWKISDWLWIWDDSL